MTGKDGSEEIGFKARYSSLAACTRKRRGKKNYLLLKGKEGFVGKMHKEEIEIPSLRKAGNQGLSGDVINRST